MRTPILLPAALVLAVLCLPAAAKPGNGGGPKPKPTPVAKGRPGAAKASLTATALDADAAATVDTKRFPGNRGREEREWLRVKASNLDPAKTYTVWLAAGDDAATTDVDETVPLTEVGTLAHDAKDAGDADDRWQVRFDDHKAGVLPLGDLPLARFEGQAIEVRESDGDPLTTTDPAVLQGTVPTIGPKK